jgi:peptide/nickel transport system ATP-binding protein
MTDVQDAQPGVALGGARPLLEVRDMIQEFVVQDRGGVRGGQLQAVAGVSFDLRESETLGLVGESGSGKSTLARSLLQLPPPKSGAVVLDGIDLTKLGPRNLVRTRRAIQMVFQDPVGSLDVRWTVSQIIEEPLIAANYGNRKARQARVEEVLRYVGLDPKVHGGRKPRQLSGGQCQRVAIARAIAIGPKLIICDEAVASLDVIIKSQILNLFKRLRAELGLSYLFIAHDLALVRQVSDRVMVMYLGRICEVAPAEAIYAEPRHPYTVALLASVLSPDPRPKGKVGRRVISGEVPSPLNPPSGCRFRTRCPRAAELCEVEVPELREVGEDHFVACHFPVEVKLTRAAGQGEDRNIDGA